MAPNKVFLDTDVVISSFLSQKGAAYKLINKQQISKIISRSVKEEAAEVIKRININPKKVSWLSKKVRIVQLDQVKEKIIKTYSPFVFDHEDSHIVAGAHLSGCQFLLTYNLKNYDREKIKNKLKIIIMKPGNFLQYLRSN